MHIGLKEKIKFNPLNTKGFFNAKHLQMRGFAFFPVMCTEVLFSGLGTETLCPNQKDKGLFSHSSGPTPLQNTAHPRK